MLRKIDFGAWGTAGALLAAFCQGVQAQQPPTTTIGKYFVNVPGSVLTRASNTAAYAANETICLFASGTACVPGTISIAAVNNGFQFINRVTLLKSGIATAAATFTIWLYGPSAPSLTVPTQFDATPYSGPRAADLPNYIGNAACNTPILTSDTTASVWYECTLSNPNTAGALASLALSGTTQINYLISVTTTAYAPASAETFTPYLTGFY